jgi:hypothetical protein
LATVIARTIQRLHGAAPDAELGDTLAEFFTHRFTEAEILDELRDAGYELLSFRPYPYPHAIASRR